MSTDPATRLRAFTAAARHTPGPDAMGLAAVTDANGVRHVLTEDDLDAVLDELEQLRAERNADVRTIAALLELDLRDADLPVGEYIERREAVRERFADRIAELNARENGGDR